MLGLFSVQPEPTIAALCLLSRLRGATEYAARAAGHAAATAHLADHELGGAYFALLTIQASAPDDPGAVNRELLWQREMLPSAVAELVLDDMPSAR